MTNLIPVLQALGPMVGAAFTALAAFFGVMVAQGMTSRREHKIKANEATERRQRERDEFQIKTLLELQDAMTNLTLVAANLWGEGFHAFKETGQWGTRDSSGVQTVSHEPSEAYRVANNRVSVLKMRVLDDSLRSRLDEFQNMAMRTAIGRTPEEARQYFDALPHTFNSANERLGEILRSLL